MPPTGRQQDVHQNFQSIQSQPNHLTHHNLPSHSSTNIPPPESQSSHIATQSQSLNTSNAPRQLDALWEEYLRLLHDYATAQAAIQQSTSAGFFSLAQANFKSPGRRYGKDYYDQRAVATARVQWKVEDDESVNGAGNDEAVRMRIGRVDVTKHGEGHGEQDPKDLSEKLSKTTIDSEHNDEANEKEAEPSAASNHDHGQDSPRTEKTPKTDDTEPSAESEDKPPINPHDPIRQFGILVPPTLRTAQKSFNSAVLGEDCVAKAVEAARGMRRVEVEIRKWRKEIRKMERIIEPSREL